MLAAICHLDFLMCGNKFDKALLDVVLHVAECIPNTIFSIFLLTLCHSNVMFHEPAATVSPGNLYKRKGSISGPPQTL